MMGPEKDDGITFSLSGDDGSFDLRQHLLPMASTHRVDAISNLIREQMDSLLKSAGFKQWAKEEKLAEGDMVVFNNSFLYREGIRSNKSPLYLGVAVGKESELTASPFVITSRSAINVRFKRVAARTVQKYQRIALKDAVKQDLSRLGHIILALVAQIEADEPASIEISLVSGFDTVRYDPSQGRMPS